MHRPLNSRTELHALPGLIWRAVRIVWQAAPRQLGVGAVLQVLSGAVTGFQVIVMQHLTAEVLRAAAAGQGYERAGIWLGVLVLIQSGTAAIGLVTSQQQQLMGQLVSKAVMGPVLEVAGTIPLKDFESPELQNRLGRVMQNAVNQPQQIVGNLTHLLSGLSTLGSVAAALFIINPLLVLVPVVTVLPAWIINRKASLVRYEYYVEMAPQQRFRGYLLQLLTQLVSAKEIRAFGLADHFRRRYLAVTDEINGRLRESLRRQRLFSFLSSAANSVSIALGFGALAWLLVTRRIGVPGAAAALQGGTSLAAAVAGLGSATLSIYENTLYIADLEAFVALRDHAEHDRSRSVPSARFQRIQLEGVDFTYPQGGAAHEALSAVAGMPAAMRRALGYADPETWPGTTGPRQVLRGVDLEIRRGEIVAVVGENGSGKTTLAKILCGLYRPDGGRVAWDGVDTAGLDPRLLREQITVVFQDFAKFMLTARENIGLGRVENLADVQGIVAAARQAGADEFIATWPKGYETDLGPVFQGGRDVSVGQWQRIAIARAFFRDASLVILDEPTAALDPRAEHALFERIRKLFAGRSVLLISHRFSSVRSADRIYVLSEGVVVEHGTHDDLMMRNGLYAELFTLQSAAYLGPARAEPTKTEG